jgi:hypothetical protein
MIGKRSNEEIRRWYLEQVARVEQLNEEWIRDGVPAEERALRAWTIRHDLRKQAREMMLDPEEVRALEQRDVLKYGNPDGPTFEWLLDSGRRAGLDGDALYDWIIRGAQRTDPAVNRRLGMEGKR